MCDEVTREARNLSVLKDRNQLHHAAEERPAGGKGAKGGGAGSTTRCKHCHQPGHPAALCPTEAAKKRGELEKLVKDLAPQPAERKPVSPLGRHSPPPKKAVHT